ncbi:MAG: hypothetical protein BRD38_05585 [Bacteroidetes bacterium QH_9_67_14]|nr:MAG: hypothetical protein BRD38_05585 [Bacteroidetes bacterium QH_9_67_14]
MPLPSFCKASAPLCPDCGAKLDRLLAAYEGDDGAADGAVDGSTPENVTFDASESSDPDGDISSYEWTFGDGGSASGQEVTYTFEQDGNIRAELTVRDDGELSNSTAQTVTVGETTQPPPTMSANYDTTGRVITVTETDAGEGIVPIDQDGNEIGDDAEVTWSSDFTYRLDGRVFVNEGQVLRIEPGTIIQGKQSKAVEDTGTLIVARGGQIDASGEPENPIVFTAEGDADPSSISPSEFEDRGFWGGVIVLGHAPNNVGEGGAGVNNVEGLGDLPRAAYGCGGGDFSCDEDDSSGTLEYVSIRFGGFEITPGNEINGLTMGSVGEGTCNTCWPCRATAAAIAPASTTAGTTASPAAKAATRRPTRRSATPPTSARPTATWR